MTERWKILHLLETGIDPCRTFLGAESGLFRSPIAHPGVPVDLFCGVPVLFSFPLSSSTMEESGLLNIPPQHSS